MFGRAGYITLLDEKAGVGLIDRYIMGYVVVISLPVILLFLITAIACYLLGRARGRQENLRLPQYNYGPPVTVPPHLGPHTPAPDK